MPMFYGLSGSAARVFGVDVYGGPDTLIKKAIILPVHRIALRIHNVLWAVRHRFHPRHRYNMIKTGLPPGYYDVDTLMLHGCFSLLCRYVEDECGGADDLLKWTKDLMSNPDHNAPDGCLENQANGQLKALELYLWWKHELPAMKKRRNDLMDILYSSPIVTEPVEGSNLLRVVRRNLTDEDVALHSELDEIKTRIEKESDEMLHRLIKIRGGLWT